MLNYGTIQGSTLHQVNVPDRVIINSVKVCTVQRAVRFCSDRLIRCEQRIKATIRDSSVIGVDETGIRINGTNAWVHVARTDTLIHLAPHTHRDRKAFQTIGIIN